MCDIVYRTVLEDVIKSVKRDISILRITKEFSLNPKLSNLVKYDNELVQRRKKIFGISIGRKYFLEDGSTDSALYKAMDYIRTRHDVILTGSCSLRTFGLIERHVGDDLDFIANQETINEMSNLYSEYTHFGYGDSPDLNYVKTFVIKSMKVDVFLDKGDKYEMVEGLKVHDPFELMKVKLNMGRHKDIQDSQEFIKLLREKIV